MSGYTALAVNKLDVLSGTGEIPIATAYRIDGAVTDEFPMTLAEIERAEPHETPGGLERGPDRPAVGSPSFLRPRAAMSSAWSRSWACPSS